MIDTEKYPIGSIWKHTAYEFLIIVPPEKYEDRVPEIAKAIVMPHPNGELVMYSTGTDLIERVNEEPMPRINLVVEGMSMRCLRLRKMILKPSKFRAGQEIGHEDYPAWRGVVIRPDIGMNECALDEEGTEDRGITAFIHTTADTIGTPVPSDGNCFFLDVHNPHAYIILKEPELTEELKPTQCKPIFEYMESIL